LEPINNEERIEETISSGEQTTAVIVGKVSLAQYEGSSLKMTTFHKDCEIEGSYGSLEVPVDIDAQVSDHLTLFESCTCDPLISSVLEKPGDTLLLRFRLSDVVTHHPWLRNHKSVSAILKIVEAIGSGNLAFQIFNFSLAQGSRVGPPGWLFEPPEDDGPTLPRGA